MGGTSDADDDSRWYIASKDEKSKSGGNDANDHTREDSIASKLVSEVRRLRENQMARREMYRFLLEQYSVSESVNLGLSSFDASSTFSAPTMPFNIVRRGVNTVFAKCAKNRPLPMVLANHGDYKEHKRARGLTNFLAGLFTHLKVPSEVGGPLCKFALALGTGIAHVYHTAEDQFPRIDIVFPWEFFVPTTEARSGKPKTFYIVKWVDVQVLIALYPEREDEIRAAVGKDTDDTYADSTETNSLVLVYYGWRVASSKNKRGMWAVCVDGAMLASDTYEREYPPFAFLRYNRPLIGFFGEGLASEMCGFQYELNFTTESLRMSHRTAPTGIWVTDDNSGIPDTTFSNDIGYVIKKRPGSSLTYENPTPAPPQTYQWHEMVSEGGLKWSGISTMSANAEKPAGVTAGVALNTLDDIEADNFAVFQQDYETCHIDLSNLLIDEMKAMAEEHGADNIKILVQDKRSAVGVTWSEVDMNRDAILLQTFPVALLRRTPAARKQYVADLFKDGVIDRALYLKLLDAPDIDAEVDLDSATRTLCDEQIDHILEAEDTDADDAYVHPMPFTDLVYALRRATQMVCLATIQKRPEANIALLMQYVEECKVELKRQNADENAMKPPVPPGTVMGPDGQPMPMGAPPGGPMGGAPDGPGMPPGAMPPPMIAPPPGAGLGQGMPPGGVIPS